MKLIYAVIFAGIIASSQPQPLTPRYMAVKETSLSSAAEKITIQQPSPTSRNVSFESADVYCSVACIITIQQNGTAATATSLAVLALNESAPGTTVAFSSSNVGTGTTGKSYYIPAGGTLVLDLSSIFLLRGGATGNNFSIGTNSITGTVRIQIQWIEN